MHVYIDIGLRNTRYKASQIPPAASGGLLRYVSFMPPACVYVYMCVCMHVYMCALSVSASISMCARVCVCLICIVYVSYLPCSMYPLRVCVCVQRRCAGRGLPYSPYPRICILLTVFPVPLRVCVCVRCRCAGL